MANTTPQLFAWAPGFPGWLRLARRRSWPWTFAVGLAGAAAFAGGPTAPRSAPGLSGIRYTNEHVAEGPWSIHVVRFERSNPGLAIRSAHAEGRAIGLSPLTAHLNLLPPAAGTPVAAINGDFYQRDRAYAGDPRGLQIADGEVLSAPNGGVSLWIDTLGQPQASNVISQFTVRWPDGTLTPFGLNGDRPANGLMLYTPAIGSSTHTTGGRELILERAGDGPWLPLRMGGNYPARIREVRESGDSELTPETMVLSLGPTALSSLSKLAPGAELSLATASLPGLAGAATGISGGPILVRRGKRQKFSAPTSESYEFSSMLERHPRTAIGWNKTEFFLVEVDGRQKNLSVGMTLDELSAYLVKLGCEEAMNLDGGGSATLWYDGKVRNSPCDGRERAIANSLVVVRKGGTREKAATP